MRGRPTLKSIAIPAPTGGWNAKDPIASLKATEAVTLENFFPDSQDVSLRKGYRVHATAVGTGAVETLAEHVGTDGTRTLIAAGGGGIYDASTYNDDATLLDDEFTEDRWQTVNFGGKLIMVNGADQPQQFDGTTLSGATYTGVASDDTLINVANYKGRLYFVEDASASIWYGVVAEITGALTEYDCSTLLKLGGELVFAGSWTRDTGAGLTDYFCACSSMGELLLFTGSYPGGDDWTISGRFYLPIPLGRRSITNIGGDLAVVTQGGVFPLSTLLSTGSAADEFARLTDKISEAFRQAAVSYGTLIGWEMLYYPRGRMLYVNVPQIQDSVAEQFVMNTETGAWTLFSGMNAVTWCLFNEKPYFGSTGGIVYEADTQWSDAGAAIHGHMKLAYNYFGDIKTNKRFLMAKPLSRSTGELAYKMNIDPDFRQRTVLDTVTVIGAGGTPWSSPWGSAWSQGAQPQDDWRCLDGIGRCGALELMADFLDVRLSFSAFLINYEQGGLM
jgi:hypothetical protein